MKERTADELRKDLNLYHRYCQHHTLRAQAHERAVATNLFLLMLNPRMRGPKFRWSTFEDMAAEDAETSAHSGFSDRIWKIYGPLIKGSAASSARITARECLRASAVETWLPLKPDETSE